VNLFANSRVCDFVRVKCLSSFPRGLRQLVFAMCLPDLTPINPVSNEGVKLLQNSTIYLLVVPDEFYQSDVRGHHAIIFNVLLTMFYLGSMEDPYVGSARPSLAS